MIAGENQLHGEINELESELESILAKMKSDKHNVNSIETKLEKCKTNWLGTKTEDRIRQFVLKDEYTAQKFTGLNYSARNSLWEYLGPAKEELQIWKRKTLSRDLRAMSVEDQFLMTLVILRKGWDYAELANIFDLDQQLVSAVFKTWLQFMYCIFAEDEEFFFTKSSDIDKKTIPECFQKTKEFQNVRAVIDCTEIFIESSR